jgi:YfiH family protein
MGDNVYITFKIFDPFEEIVCAFSTRLVVNGEEIQASENEGNTGSNGSHRDLINRNHFFDRLKISKDAIVYPAQVHSANFRHVFMPGIVPKTDALVTQTRGLFLSIQTADCFPIFLYAPKKNVVGIIHAGWRGAKGGIISRTLNFMQCNIGTDLSDLHVAIGPGIQKECFEVRVDVYEQFPEKYLIQHGDSTKRYLDLCGFLKDELITNNVPDYQIYVQNECTKCRNDLYYSYRMEGQKSGRMLGIIGIRG